MQGSRNVMCSDKAGLRSVKHGIISYSTGGIVVKTVEMDIEIELLDLQVCFISLDVNGL